MERIKGGFSDSDETAFVEAMLAYFSAGLRASGSVTEL
jgi:hypothetical protein